MTEIKKVNTLAWRRHLLSDAGIEGMLFLRERVPSIAKGDSDSIIFDAGKAEGYKQAIDTISEIIGVAPEKEQKIDND